MRKIYFLFLVFALSNSVFADTVSDKEKDALIKIYHATNGGEWKVKWDLTSSVSAWFGVEINNGKVVGLNLSNNNLKGELPSAIGSLQHLQILALFDNQIGGGLPDSLYEISTLKVLLLNNNKFSGSLSYKIRNFNVLENLSLFDNSFEGEIPKELENLNHLSEMNLSYNRFKGSVSKKLTLLDALNMTMFDQKGNPFLLDVNEEKEIRNNSTVN
ncbi:leucine-rich repeat domain-containing protein [Flavobacterium salmonis]|uniref:Two component regulator three Y domain protein n=1 Tax=Flavobacterium salmonis TaxID=2654844 RepID=A0A6V6YSF7_9FLAO|nr:Two component regulator three Y domain protein [Flavobacterium salmonis]CAD0002421.1 Two component regulator three Y domain protein [Flavobacterium salmonis]